MRCFLLALLLVLVASPAWAAPSLVQSKAHFTGGASSTPTVTADTNLSANNLYIIEVFIISSTTVTLSSVSGCGETWTVVATVSGTSDSQAIAYAKNGSGGCATITATLSSGNNATIFLQEVSGTDTTAAADATGCQKVDSPGGGTDAIASPTLTTTVAGTYLWGGYTASANGMTAGTGFTNVDLTGGVSTGGTEYQITGGAGNYAALATGTTGTNFYTACAMAFKPAGAATPRPRHRVIQE